MMKSSAPYVRPCPSDRLRDDENVSCAGTQLRRAFWSGVLPWILYIIRLHYPLLSLFSILLAHTTLTLQHAFIVCTHAGTRENLARFRNRRGRKEGGRTRRKNNDGRETLTRAIDAPDKVHRSRDRSGQGRLRGNFTPPSWNKYNYISRCIVMCVCVCKTLFKSPVKKKRFFWWK